MRSSGVGETPSILILLLLNLHLSQGTGTIDIRTGDSIQSLRNQDVFIPCTISHSSATKLDLKKLSVQWSLKLPNGTEVDLYLYVSRNVTHNRRGLNISETDLVLGNAGFTITQIQFSDEGEYTCTITYTPNKKHGTINVEVSAQPIITLEPQHLVAIELETEKTILCEAKGFYPGEIKLQWVKHLSPRRHEVLDAGTCFRDPKLNKDGTFNVTSHLTLKPLLVDNGSNYSCVVKHKSTDTRLLNFTLLVKEPDTQKKDIAVAVFITFASVLSVISLIIGYFKFVIKEPPKLSPITGAEHLVHMNRATLSCLISGFRPKPNKITLWLKGEGENREEIYSWVLEERWPVSNGVTTLSPAQRPLRVEMVPVITTSKYQRLSNCQCTIHITPDIEEDNGKELFLWVSHSALRVPISVSCRLRVKGVKPKLSEVVSPLRILHGESLTLTCPINGFKPKPLAVTWLKVDSRGHETELLSWDRGTINIPESHAKYSHHLAENKKEDDDHMNYFLSNLTLKPTVRADDGAQYVCRTHHYATGESALSSIKLEILAVPELDPIQTSLEVLSAGEEIELSCRIHSFHPQTLTVSWYKGNEILSSHRDQALQGASDLLECTSSITYRPCAKDIGKKFRCEVSHPSLQNPKCVSWELKHLICEPTIGEIECDPEVPECDKPVTLSCTVRDFYPEICSTRWYEGRKSISPTNDTEPAQQDPESGLFSKTIKMILTPTIGQHGMEYQLEMTHSMKMIIRTFCVKLKGFPDVKDITCNKNPPNFRELLTLSCEVIGCDAHDVTAEWRVSGEPIEREMRSGTQINTNSVSFFLTLTPTAEHCGKVFTCLVRCEDLQQPFKKNILLRLPDVPPTLSEIMVFPKDPLINKEAIFKINISGFSQRKLGVKWFGSGKQLTEHVETSEPEIGLDGLYSCSSAVRYTPTYKDLIQCQVVTNKGHYLKLYYF
ncbi:uncharacterized protein LOC108713437 [Xenopus laevis]|uniref:Uncharacterized protein LOC108713437 n=1 Tax=Xenopus laevis TaxID=8355 RepID=A0A8J1MUZ3_XENLA|nr:uncharacterized protein LOC108713437 [Xenopus laevis]